MNFSALEYSIKALERSLGIWESWLVVATLLVVAGLVLEYRHEIKDLLGQRPLKWKSVQKILGAILVTVGVAGELAVQFEASRIETSLRDDNDKLEQSLRMEAKKAEDSAESERLERMKLQASLSDRHITIGQRDAMLKILRVRKGSVLVGFATPAESDAQEYAMEIEAVFREAGWAIQYADKLVLFGKPIHGFWVEYWGNNKPENKPLALVACKALRATKYPVGCVDNTPENVATDAARVWVGLKR